MPLVLYLNCHHHTQGHFRFLLCCLLSFTAWCFTFRPVIHFELSFVECKIYVWMHCFTCRHPVFPRKTMLLHCIAFVSSHQRSVVWVCLGLFPGSLFSSTDLLMYSFSPMPHCLNYYSLQVLKSGRVSPPNLVFFSFLLVFWVFGQDQCFDNHNSF